MTLYTSEKIFLMMNAKWKKNIIDASPIPTAEEAKVILRHSTNYWEFTNAMGLASRQSRNIGI